MTYIAVVKFKKEYPDKYITGLDLGGDDSIEVEEDFIYIGEEFFVDSDEVLFVELLEEEEEDEYEDVPDVEGLKQEVERLRAELAVERMKKAPYTYPNSPNTFPPYPSPGTPIWTTNVNYTNPYPEGLEDEETDDER